VNRERVGKALRVVRTAVLVLAAVRAAAEPRAFEPRAYHVEIRPDLEGRSIRGRTTIVLERCDPQAREWLLPTPDLVVTAVSVEGRSMAFTSDSGSLVVAMPDSAHPHVVVDYQGTPKRGLVFGDGYVYTAFHTSHWMIADDDPGTKAPLVMEIVAPAALTVVASGELVETRRDSDDVRHVWRQERPYSSYLYGFAAGRFHEAMEPAGNNTLRFLGVRDGEEALRRKLAPTAEMLAFFENKAGVPLPHPPYTQVVVPNDEAQEVSTFSVLGHGVLDPILTDPHEDWAIAHELAHQWWGNLITCRTWRDFWLNEGVTVFMVAAYKQHKWGQADYERELALCRRRWQRAADEGWDKPLRFDGPYPSLRTKRAIVYSKGALFMAALREEVGDERFWPGLRAYTRAHAGRSVTTDDFRAAMEDAAGRSLADLFARWVD
jgi:aminopeptidase N